VWQPCHPEEGFLLRSNPSKGLVAYADLPALHEPPCSRELSRVGDLGTPLRRVENLWSPLRPWPGVGGRIRDPHPGTNHQRLNRAPDPRGSRREADPAVVASKFLVWNFNSLYVIAPPQCRMDESALREGSLNGRRLDPATFLAPPRCAAACKLVDESCLPRCGDAARRAAASSAQPPCKTREPRSEEK